MAAKMIFSGVFGILCLQLVFCQQQNLAPYSLIETARDDNSVTLSCQGSGGFDTPGAFFFRNGVDRDSDPCLQQASVDEIVGDLELSLAASCEGNYMCGIAQPGGKFILSGPRTVFAYPQPIPGTLTSTLPINAVEGDSVDLPCDVERSFLNQFIVTWYRAPPGGGLDPLPNAANPDYSLTLDDLEVSQSGIYVCTVTANSSFLADALTRTVNGRSIDLIVRSRHIPVFFQSELAYEVDGSGRMLFSVSARGTQSLSFKWFLDDKQDDSGVVSVTTSIGSEVIVQSKLELETLPRSPSSVRVSVSNMDPFTLETFTVNQSALLVSNNEQPPTVITQLTEPSTSSSSVEDLVTGCSAQQMTLIGFFSAAAMLIVALVVFLLLLLLFRKHIHFDFKKSSKCRDNPETEGSLTESGHDVEEMFTRQDRECKAVVNPPCDISLLKPSSSNHHYTVVTAPDLASPKYCNPIANMLVKVAFLIGENKVELNQDMAVITAIDHILGEVLSSESGISRQAVKYMEEMKVEVGHYASKIRERRFLRRNLSRSSAITPGSMGTPMTPVATNHVKKHPLAIGPSIEELDEAPKLDPKSTASQSEDMVDGVIDSDSDNDSDSEECHQMKIAKNISDKLYEWLSRQRQGPALKANTDRSAVVADNSLHH